MNGIKILIAGDLCLQDRTAEATLEELLHLHESCKPHIESADYTIVNLECAVVTSSTPHPIKKAGPALKCSDKVVDFAKELGFKACTLANNHFADYGDAGVRETLTALKQSGLDYVGAGLNLQDAERILYKTINGKNFAFINACEHEFTVATNTKAGCNPLNPIRLSYKIKEAKSKADYVVMIIHGGHEEYQLPSPRMQETYRFFIDMGADAVINHHQHCYSGYEMYQGKPIFYGLGNFSFDENGLRCLPWNEGYMLSLEFGDAITFNLIPYVQNDEQIGIQLMTGERKEKFKAYIRELNSIITDQKLLQECWNKKAEELRNDYLTPLQPYQYSRLVILAKHHLLPKKLIAKLLPEYMTETRRLFLKSYFQCESHRDIMNKLLEL